MYVGSFVVGVANEQRGVELQRRLAAIQLPGQLGDALVYVLPTCLIALEVVAAA